MEVTFIDLENGTGVYVCDNCGASAEKAESIQHHKTCIPGESKKWEKFYNENKEGVLESTDDMKVGAQTLFGDDEDRLKKVGHFVGVNWVRGKLGFNSVPLSLEEFMYVKGIEDPNDIVGPFADKDLARKYQWRIANFFRKWSKEREAKGAVKMPNVTLMDLFEQNQI